MKRLFTLLIVVVTLATLVIRPASAQTTGEPYVVVFKMNKIPADVQGFITKAGGKLLMWIPQVGIAVASAETSGFSTKLGSNASVESFGLSGKWSVPTTNLYAPELTAPTATDAFYFAYQWDIRRVGADQAWAAGVTGSHNTVVAVIDTGIDASHPDLAPNVVFQGCMQLAGPCASSLFTHWHGTHVAGTVAAAFGGGRAVGVGPNLGLAGYQVFEDGGDSAYDGPIWWAIVDSADRGFEVINMSLGDYYQFGQTQGDGAAVWNAWKRVINYAVSKGVTVVASAGNGDVNLNGTIYHIPSDIPNVINVAATGIQPDPIYPQPGSFDIRAFYSNYGSPIDIAAPGGDCGEIDDCTGAPPSGYPYYLYLVFSTLSDPEDGFQGYGWAGGTSMASPHVAGAAALIKDVNPGLSPQQVKSILKRTADNIGSRQLFGSGMLDVLEAVQDAD